MAIKYFKGTNAKIRIVINDDQLVAQGITDFTLIGSTVVVELESSGGDFVKFANSQIAKTSATILDITPTVAQIKELQIGLHDVAGQVTVGTDIYGFKIPNGLEVERLIQT